MEIAVTSRARQCDGGHGKISHEQALQLVWTLHDDLLIVHSRPSSSPLNLSPQTTSSATLSFPSGYAFLAGSESIIWMCPRARPVRVSWALPSRVSKTFEHQTDAELLKINHYKAPRDKMICILNCCKVIFGLLRHVQDSTSADAFIPILIFVVLQANPENLLSNVEYITRFRSSSKLQGEAGYYLSSLGGAVAFIETMDASSLSNITQEEFESHVEAAIQDLPPSPTLSPRPTGPQDMSPFATTEGEEPARALASRYGAREFLKRTGDLAQEAVSKPLNAIGKILETMQTNEEVDERTPPGMLTRLVDTP